MAIQADPLLQGNYRFSHTNQHGIFCVEASGGRLPDVSIQCCTAAWRAALLEIFHFDTEGGHPFEEIA
jgi:hypothetical protein